MNAPPGFMEPDSGTWQTVISELASARAEELAHRAGNAPLFAHAYSFHLNFRLGGMLPVDLLEFAAAHGLKGVKIHVEDGEENSLLNRPEHRRIFGTRASELGLNVHIETSHTSTAALAELIRIAKETDATSIRCYPRYEARVSDIVSRTIKDLEKLGDLDPGRTLRVTLEQHEDLTSSELVHIVDSVADSGLSLLFDFGNMVNAHERPLEALRAQSKHITEVHIKDCLVEPDRCGWAQRGCVSGTGHIPFADLLLHLLLLGADRPQVTAFGLEEEVDYFAPAMRFPGEDTDPFIRFRTASLTDVGKHGIGERLIRERDEATAQIATVRALLTNIQQVALEAAAQPSTSQS